MRYIPGIFILIVTGHFALAAGPVAKSDSATVLENFQVTIPVTANDSDASGGALGISIAFSPLYGTATVIGTNVLYKPIPGFFGVDSFNYRVCDTQNLCDNAEVYILVKGSNLPPVVNDDTYTFADTVSNAILNVLANDTDPANDTLYIGAVFATDSNFNAGTVTIDTGAHSLLFNHIPLTCGTAVFMYTACNVARCDTAQITINITCPDSIFLPQGFSPNGDGKNDYLVFPGLEYFSPVVINVFNRYGTTVYKNNNYLNDWDGTDAGSHQPLPDGTYFYILTLPSGRTYNNYLVINR